MTRSHVAVIPDRRTRLLELTSDGADVLAKIYEGEAEWSLKIVEQLNSAQLVLPTNLMSSRKYRSPRSMPATNGIDHRGAVGESAEHQPNEGNCCHG
jgi:hypothetical protein